MMMMMMMMMVMTEGVINECKACSQTHLASVLVSPFDSRRRLYLNK